MAGTNANWWATSLLQPPFGARKQVMTDALGGVVYENPNSVLGRLFSANMNVTTDLAA